MSTKTKKILIIEDEKPIAHALELKLTHQGFEVTVVSDGEEGFVSIQKEKYDLILSDLVMPKMDGFTLLYTLKENNIDTPLMILSNLSQEDDQSRAKELGAKEFFIKSDTSIAEIVEHVVAFLK